MKISIIIIVCITNALSVALGAEGSPSLRGQKHDTTTKMKGNLFDPPVTNVINGDGVTDSNRYPWIAQWRAGFSSSCCGGTLVAPNFVLSAAHCECSGNIRVGHRDRNNADEGEIIDIANKFIHPQNNGFDYDFVLLKLERNSVYAPTKINPDASVPANYGDDLWVAGWGETLLSSYPRILQEAHVPYQDCGDVWNRATDRQMCAEWSENDIRDACAGDSGGPLFIKDVNDPTNPSKDVVVGVVSYGDYPCDHTKGNGQSYYGVYSRISSEFAWIQDTICDNGGETAGTSFTCGTPATTTVTSTTTAITTTMTGTTTGATTGATTTDAAMTTSTMTPTTAIATPFCGDGICGFGESCDGRGGTLECEDCNGKTNGNPNDRYCCVGGTTPSCEGPGCTNQC